MEVEVKIMMKPDEWQKYIDQIHKDIGRVDEVVREDTYYSKYGSLENGKKENEPLIRIRKEVDLNEDYSNVKYYLTIKRKQLLGDAETNVEIENIIESDPEGEKPEALWELLKVAGYKPVFTKTKESRGYHTADDMHIEFVKVSKGKKTLYALEVEKIIEESSPGDYVSVVSDELDYIAGVYSPELPTRLESRTWKQLLEE